MAAGANNEISIGNKKGTLEIDLFGGAITNFYLRDGEINPLSFRFTKEQMPANNKGAFYKGHFVCLGRWGEPSIGEMHAGIPNHGEAASILWHGNIINETTANMGASCLLEGFQVTRNIQFDDNLPVYMVQEYIKNVNPLGRLYNIVQHPTLAAPFLTNNTIVNCNAQMGFNRLSDKDPLENATIWPHGKEEDNTLINLSMNKSGITSLYSFIINREDSLGWITAYSPEHQLLLGYIWSRSHYPWINLWQDWNGNQIRYRGLEFGTTGLHQPFNQILKSGQVKIFDEHTFKYIDAGETSYRCYISFLQKVNPNFNGVKSLLMSDNVIYIFGEDGSQNIVLDTVLNNPLQV